MMELAKKFYDQRNNKEKRNCKIYQYKILKNPLLSEYLKDLYTRLNINNENQFELFLKKKSFSLDEIKKKIKIELFWNELIYLKYHGSLKIDEELITKKIKNLKNEKK